MKLFLINMLTVSRIFLGSLIFLFLTRTDLYWAAFVLFIFAGITDFDGYYARKYNAVSEIGEILDPIADKILIVFLLLQYPYLFQVFMLHLLGQ